jgi:hypothetical protein
VRGNRGRDGSYPNFPSPIHCFNGSVGHGGKIKIFISPVPTGTHSKQKKKKKKKKICKQGVGGRERKKN